MKKALIIISVITLLLAIVLGVLSFISDKDKIVINTNDGDVEINDIYQRAEKILSNDNLALKETEDYLIEYHADSNLFSIGILNSDVEKAIAKAENDFLSLLGITEEEACRLEVTVGVPHSVSPYHSGKIYSLSFCQ